MVDDTPLIVTAVVGSLQGMPLYSYRFGPRKVLVVVACRPGLLHDDAGDFGPVK